MSAKSGYDFLADTVRCSDGYAIQYAFTVSAEGMADSEECWKIVLSRKTLNDSDALDIAVGLGSKELFIHVISERKFEPRKIIETCEYLFSDEPAVWVALFELDYIVVYIEELGVDSVLENFATIKSQMFSKYIKDLYPGMSALSPVADCELIENECNAEDLLAAAEKIVPYTNKN